MNGEALIAKVVKRVQDPDLEEEDILDFLNEGLVDVSSRVRIPGLSQVSSVDTVVGNNIVTLPSDYQRGLFKCRNTSDTAPITVLNSRQQMHQRTGVSFDDAGSVRYVCVSAGSLLYQLVPGAITSLELSYYMNPVEIAEDSEPTCLPANFHKMLVFYAAFNLFDDIEDGIDGAKVNTTRWESRYEREVAKLKLFYKDGQSYVSPLVVRSNGDL